MADLRVNHGPIDPEVADDLTDEEKVWLRNWNRGDEIPDESGEVSADGDGDEDDDDDEDESGDYSEWSADDLKAALRERDLPVSGNKDDLIARLEEDDSTDIE